MNSDQNLIAIKNISVDFSFQENFLSKKQKIQAVKNVSLNIKKGSFVGLVGESGSGKTTLGRAILAANKISSGKVIFHDGDKDYDLTNISKQELKEYRKKAQLIFQDPLIQNLIHLTIYRLHLYLKSALQFFRYF